ncbi:MAG: aminotransferase class I/II-fold pyridoxal phosphate-dependent enzyme [Firmicutes bacterium]|nr:aminotransferase class I/II-fold pyridoxal phosphate-dependent enzyme [Bacillota bacterium]
MITFEKSNRIKSLSSSVFTQVTLAKQKVLAHGGRVIDLSVGSPDLTPAPHVIEAMERALRDPGNYGYPLVPLPELKEALAAWYQGRFGVHLDPRDEVLVLMGTQDGLAHITLGLANPGEAVLVPDPGYPIYHAGPVLADAQLAYMPLLESNGFLPDLEAIPPEVARRAKLMIINYPSNPLSAVAGRDFFEGVVDFATNYNIPVAHDVTYSELAFDGYRPMSFLEVPGAREVGIEFYSVSKTYNLAGIRLGFAVGNRKILAALAEVKSHVDFGVFRPLQYGALAAGALGFAVGNRKILAALAEVKSHVDFGVFRPLQYGALAALRGPQDQVEETRRSYQRRRDLVIAGLERLAWRIPRPKATMFIWARVPLPMNSTDFAIRLLEETGVAVVPGVGFGPSGEGYVRIALVQKEDLLEEAIERMARSSMLQALPAGMKA